MKVSLIALACTALLGATSAMARDGHRDDRGNGGNDRHSYTRDNGHGRNNVDRGYRYDRHDRNDRHDRYDRHDARHGDGRGDRHYSSWRRGGYYSHGGGYVLHDYGRYHLRHPGYGYHWVRDGRDYLLVALATGLIADVIIDGYGY